MASSPSSPGHAFPLPKRPRLRIGWTTERQWSDLPYEILQLIADGLGIIDLLSFRGVCKDWNSASTTASAKIESSLQLSDPWFLLYGESPECILLSRTGEKYSINIPLLDAGATCIASNDGWLLLLLEQERAVSFFCPFSGAKIDLPNLPEADSITSCIATFSSPPTSSDCIVGVLRQNAALQIELLMLHRGDTSWREAKYEDSLWRIKMFRCASYNDGIFNFTHDVKGLLTYNDEQKEWKRFAILDLVTSDKSKESLPFRLGKNFFGLMNTRQRLGLENNVSVSTCGTAVKEEECDKLIFNECIVAEHGEGSESHRNMKGVWFHPRFFLVPPNHSWLQIGWTAERQWSDLPYEILQSIADGLCIIDLLGCRGVGKDWNSASTTESAKIESSRQFSDPWFLLYGESPECILLSRTGKKYSINIPQLDGGATCIASNNGWLLLLLEQKRAASFFFKIDLPVADSITNCIAAFLSPPTSPCWEKLTGSKY